MQIVLINTKESFGEHSELIAANGWTVVNAPRPIPGEITWTGNFIHGIFYAAGPASDFQQA